MSYTQILRGGLAGGSVSFVALAMTRFTRGLPEAALFMAGLFAGALTIGLIAARLDDVLRDRLRRRRDVRAALMRSRCSECRRTMEQRGTVWVCPRCDTAPVLR